MIDDKLISTLSWSYNLTFAIRIYYRIMNRGKVAVPNRKPLMRLNLSCLTSHCNGIISTRQSSSECQSFTRWTPTLNFIFSPTTLNLKPSYFKRVKLLCRITCGTTCYCHPLIIILWNSRNSSESSSITILSMMHQCFSSFSSSTPTVIVIQEKFLHMAGHFHSPVDYSPSHLP